MKPGEPVLVASGTFRIDRGAALEKLKRYQAADPWTCLLEFVRCADRCEASRMGIDLVRGRALRLRFDGRAFGWSRMLDPFQALLRPGASDAGRHLAIGLLGALRVSKRVVVASGRQPWRWRSRIRSFDEIRLVKSQGDGTTIDLLGVSPPRRWKTPLLASCRMTHPAVTVDGEPAARGIGGKAPGRNFKTPIRRGRVELETGGKTSSIEIHTRGILAEVVTIKNGDPGIHAWVDDDGLTFDASRLKLARNRRFRGLLATVERERRALMETAAVTHALGKRGDWLDR